MKKILIVLAAGFTIISCKEADKKAEANSTTITDTAAQASHTHAANAPATAVAAQPAMDTANLTTIQWLDGHDKDFGKIKEGENLDVSFRFKNTGTKPLIISRVWAQCGCTVPETPQKPYAPGETGVIKASFNSTAKPGLNTKEVYMSANTNPATNTLVFRVDVKAKAKSK
ncbi:MAG TPA: DUF1573 domain-containing protein [Chitinophagaceae bacterium]|nr:DUF1573 domain-containing protein [Chitinophagaceae bacterium]